MVRVTPLISTIAERMGITLPKALITMAVFMLILFLYKSLTAATAGNTPEPRLT